LKLLKTFALTYGVLLTCGVIFYLVTKNNQQLLGLNRPINPAEWILAAIIVGVICFGFAVLNALMDIEQAKQQSKQENVDAQTPSETSPKTPEGKKKDATN
jgi:TRAP-type C4-dicarboxylate transport system permease small subunit